MKVIQILAESFNRYDLCLDLISESGFCIIPFDGRPVDTSVKAIYSIQAESPYENRNPSRIFTGKSFLANRIKTRIFARPFPSWANIEYLDSLSKFNQKEEYHEGNPMEPESKLFNDFAWFVRHLLPYSDYQHVIYCGVIGHCDWRVGDENFRIPANLEKSFLTFWEALRIWIFPFVNWSKTSVLIHQDHGSSRNGMAFEKAMFDGFLIVKSRILKAPKKVTWSDVRRITRELLC